MTRALHIDEKQEDKPIFWKIYIDVKFIENGLSNFFSIKLNFDIPRYSSWLISIFNCIKYWKIESKIEKQSRLLNFQVVFVRYNATVFVANRLNKSLVADFYWLEFMVFCSCTRRPINQYIYHPFWKKWEASNGTKINLLRHRKL